ncbi:MAG: MFS transporter [Candidatus Omnitrophica bacterium]|nr:MFS transporter [Candidatus Omnitrophota bacterium]MCF7894388.1 MFS transporter [Candidatus Omnitrophota bacterium]
MKKNKISPNVWYLSWVSFLNDLSSEMIMPILPLFIASLGGGGFAIGLIGGLRAGLSSIFKILSGYWTDKTGKRKSFVFAGYLNSAVFKLFIGLSTIWQHVLVFTGLERVGKGLRTAPRDAIIADSTDTNRGRSFGLHRTFDTMGAVLGAFFALFLYWLIHLDFRTIIIVAAVISFFSLFPLYFVKAKANKPQQISFVLTFKNLPSQVKTLIFISAIFYLANFSYMFFILKSKDFFATIYSLRVANVLPIVLYILSNLIYASFSYPFGVLADKIGRRRVLAFGYLLFSLLALGFAYFEGLIAYSLLFSTYGFVNAIIDANQRAYVSDLSPKNLRASALGAFHAVVGVTSIIEGIIIGVIWQWISPFWAFIYGGLVTGIAGILFFVLKEKLNSENY